MVYCPVLKFGFMVKTCYTSVLFVFVILKISQVLKANITFGIELHKKVYIVRKNVTFEIVFKNEFHFLFSCSPFAVVSQFKTNTY